ncbi:MAG: carboxymuconolactone decarboxylase family protein [Dehalococcoidaceae bacterium]|nr:carboxymuconolactone decarboxylase family protein [Dehalococcoidaceae bacterium]
MEDTRELLSQIDSSFKAFSSQTPAQLEAFGKMLRVIDSPGKLDLKTKSLIAIGLAIAERCHWCTAYHVRNALDSGASREEILEAGWMAVLMGGSPALMQMQLLLKALDDLGA